MDVILGAGVTGLSYAMFKPDNDYLILEKDETIGGYCRTTNRNGFVWDYSGHFFHFQNPEIKRLLMDGMDPDSLVSVEKNTHIHYKGNLVDFPFQKNIHQLPKEEFIDCLVDLFEKDDNADASTFKSMLYAKFGVSIAEKFLIPYNEKLYATDLNRLDSDAMGRFFPYAEKEEIVRNFRKSQNQSYNGSFIYPKGGAIEYIRQIESHLIPENIRTGSRVEHIDIEKKEIKLSDGGIVKYDRLISTLPFTRLLDMTGIGFDDDIYGWNQVLVFNLGFDSKGTNTTDHWIYFPERDFCFYRVGFYDNILGSDRMSLYVELGFPKDAEINPEKWLPVVVEDLKRAGIVSDKQELLDYEMIIMNPAYVHITDAAKKDVEAKKKFLEDKDIYSIGRYGSWTYCSIEDNIKEASSLAKSLNI